MLGCKSGQGYLFSRPVLASAAEEFLRQGADLTGFGAEVDLGDPASLIEVLDVQ
jgi:hypothetical protein